MLDWRFWLLILVFLGGCASVDRRSEFLSFYHCASRFDSSPFCESGYYYAPIP